MSVSELMALERLVLGLALVLGLILGWVIERTHFCTMGAISDWVLMRDALRLRQWALVVAVGMLGLAGMTALGWLTPFNSIYAAERFPWLSHLFGGLIFGVGMVLSSGCPTKNLVRLGAGNLKALVVLLFMATGALGALRGAPAVLRSQWFDPWTAGVSSGPFVGQWLASLTGISTGHGLLLAALCVGSALLLWVLRDARMRTAAPLFAGLALGAVLLAAWATSGILGFVAEHPESLGPVYVATASARMEGLSFTAPLAQWLDWFAHAADLHPRWTFGMALVPGVCVGAAFSAWRRGQWRLEGFAHADDLLRHIVGALLMGVGGVYAMGCSFGQGMTGVSTLNWGSLLAVAAMMLGSWGALQWQLWRAERQG